MSTGVQRDVVINVLKQTISLSRPGFGLPLVAGYHTHFPNRVKDYGDISELVTDGFAVTEPIYKAVQAMLAQNPRVRRFKVGRLSAATKVVTITPTARNSTLYTVTINGIDFPTTSDTNATAAEIVTALTTLINANSPLPVTASGTATLILTADAAGVDFTLAVSDGAKLGLLSIKDTTADRGIASDLNAIIAESELWYGLIAADAHGATELALIATWVESQKRLAACTTADSGCIDANVTNDIMSTLKGSAITRTMLIYHPQPEFYIDAALMSRQFAQPPGSSNPAHKTFAGVPVVAMTSGQMDAVDGKNGNHYADGGGFGRLRYGRMPDGEWFDNIHGTDWLESEAVFDTYAAIASGEKNTYEQGTADMLGGTLNAVLLRGVRAKLLAATPAPVVTVPDVGDPTQVTASDRQNRVLNGIEGQAQYAGAVNRVSITLRLGE